MLDDGVAADAVGIWDEYVLRERERDPEFWTAEQVLRFFESIYLQHRPLTERDRDVVLPAIGVLFQRDQIAIPQRILSVQSLAASKELTKERLSLWDSPTKRKRALLAFLDSIAQEPVPVPRTVGGDALRFEVKKWKDFSKHCAHWVDIFHGPFVRVLDRAC